jgi:hypothetical protein
MKESKAFDYFKAWLLFFLIATVRGGIVGMISGNFVTIGSMVLWKLERHPGCSDRCSRVSKAICSLCYKVRTDPFLPP